MRLLALALFLCAAAASLAESPASGRSSVTIIAQARRPFLPPRPARAPVPSRPSSTQAEPTTIRYSQSAMAANMIMPAIYLGLPTLFIVALIIRAMKGD